MAVSNLSMKVVCSTPEGAARGLLWAAGGDPDLVPKDYHFTTEDDLCGEMEKIAKARGFKHLRQLVNGNHTRAVRGR
jgi:hypothetical protein